MEPNNVDNVQIAHKNRGSERSNFLTGYILDVFGPKSDQYSRAHVEKLIRNLNIEHNDPPLSDDEMKEAGIFDSIDDFFSDETESLFTTLDEVEIKEPEWLIKNWLPKNNVSILAGTGGDGKTTIWTAIAAAVASGSLSFLEESQPGHSDEVPLNTPGRVMYLTTEDDASRIKSLLVSNGIGEYMKNILGMGPGTKYSEYAGEFSFTSKALFREVERNRPKLVIFDPVQSFISSRTNMAARNEMRHEFQALRTMAEQFETTFLVVCHANKRAHTYGLKRIADSADIPDIARSVMMVGKTGRKDAQGTDIRYLSLEKTSYTACEKVPTILFTFDKGRIKFHGLTNKKEEEIRPEAEYLRAERTAQPDRDEAKTAIVEYLGEHGETANADLESFLIDGVGISKATADRARGELKKEKLIKIRRKGFGKDGAYYTRLASDDKDKK